MSTSKKNKKTKINKARPRTAYKLVNQAEVHFRNTESQPTNATVQKARISKSTSEINISGETGASGAGAKWYLRYLRQGLKPEEALKQTQDRPKPSLPEPRNRGVQRLARMKGKVPKNPNLNPRGEKTRAGKG